MVSPAQHCIEDLINMIFKSQQRNVLLHVVLQMIFLIIAALLLAAKLYVYALILLPLIVYKVVMIYRSQQLLQKEMGQFMESVRYRDFSQYFNIKQSPAAVKELRQGFNEINTLFKIVNKEKEAQHQYLQKVLEMVDTGILSYEEDGGEVTWINESLKYILQIPYLKTIHSLKKRNAELYDAVLILKPGEMSIVTLHRDVSVSKIMLSATAFQTEGKQYKLIAFQNVSKVLDETEAEAWQKLLRVMTHEIMNSVAPISSLAGTLQKTVQGLNKDNNFADDLELGLETIKKRSDALLKFTEVYRQLNKVTTLKRTVVYVRDLFEDLYNLMQPTLTQKNIELEIVLRDTSLTLEIDKELVEQVMINLIINAMEAMKVIDGSRIVLSAFHTTANVVIKIADNGAGIPEDVMDKIFIPFFSTKKNGNGIGLSLCKQIMLLHKGDIQVHSIEGEGTAFSLFF